MPIWAATEIDNLSSIGNPEGAVVRDIRQCADGLEERERVQRQSVRGPDAHGLIKRPGRHKLRPAILLMHMCHACDACLFGIIHDDVDELNASNLCCVPFS